MSTATPTPPESAKGGRRRWWALLVISTAQLMIVLDITIVNIALPTIQQQLDISDADRQWVVTAYTLAFAGLLLLGGRISDYMGRKRAFVVALMGFAVASAFGGASVNLEMLLTARAAQGAFGALLFPTALSLLSTTFSDPRERSTAFAVFGAVAGGGSAVGLTLGGMLTEYLSWHWVFYVSVPIAVGTAIGAAFVVAESRVRERLRFDVLGAVLATSGLTALVYGFSEAAGNGWGAARTVIALATGVVLLGLFLLTEARISQPLLPLRIVADRGRGGAFLAQMLAMVGLFGMFFFLSFYLQSVQGYTPLQAGVAFLPLTGGVLTSSVLASRIMTRVPPRALLGGGLLLAAAGMAWLTQIEVDGSYVSHVLPSLIAVGLGLGCIFPTAANLATFGVANRESGVASAALNTSQQVGASLGTALLNTVAATHTAAYLTSHPPGPRTRLMGMVDGYTLATAWAAGILAVAGVAVLVLVNARLGASTPPDSEPGTGAAPGESSLHADADDTKPVQESADPPPVRSSSQDLISTNSR